MRASQELRRAWYDSRPLTATCVLMLVAFAGSLIGIIADHRVITGVPAWLKPAKFAISTAIYTGTIAWLYRYLTIWPKALRIAGWIIAVIITLEVAIIDLQAARGTTSHFNISTPLDFTLFAVMGIGIAIVWDASVFVLITLFRQKFTDRPFGWALRLGMLITVLGSGAGGVMIHTTHEQAKAISMGQKPASNGGHTVGAEDGGPGVPGLGWSLHHGDLRIPHFFGMHAVQIVPFVYWFLYRRRRRSSRADVETPAVFSIATSYLLFVAILAWQALRGQSILEPDGQTLVALGLWLAVSISGLVTSRSVGERALQKASLVQQ